MQQLTRGVKFLLIVNIVMFVITGLLTFIPEQMTNLNDYLALFFIKSSHFKPFQYITYMFMHGGVTHLLFNMLGLFFFGVMIERIWGTKRFMFYYIVTGVGAAVVNTLVNYIQFSPLLDAYQAFMASPTAGGLESVVQKCEGFDLRVVYEIIDNWNLIEQEPAALDHIMSQVTFGVDRYTSAPMLGASGAIFGLLFAFAMMFPDVKLYIMFIPIGIKAKYLVLIYSFVELFFGVYNFSFDNVAHWAHLGGMIMGFILFMIWRKYPANNFFNS